MVIHSCIQFTMCPKNSKHFAGSLMYMALGKPVKPAQTLHPFSRGMKYDFGQGHVVVQITGSSVHSESLHCLSRMGSLYLQHTQTCLLINYTHNQHYPTLLFTCQNIPKMIVEKEWQKARTGNVFSGSNAYFSSRVDHIREIELNGFLLIILPI